MKPPGKDGVVTVPERRRVDSTMLVPPVAPESRAPSTVDPYQPPRSAGTGGMSSPPGSERELLVASTATVGSLLDRVRETPESRMELAARIAAGGMGVVEVAVDRALDRRIAVKTLHAHLRGEDSAVRMFLREARLTGLLDHPHVVPIYDIGERSGGELYFTMKLVEGQTLAALIRALPRGPLDIATLYAFLDVVTKVCDALAFAHSRAVLHCDVKPANIMVGEFGQVYLMDWGIARLAAAEASADSKPNPNGARPQRPSATDNSVIGTPCYMSPEQARGDRAKLDARSDVFLLGALLYELVTRRPPYPTNDRSETLELAAAGTFPAPRKVAGDVAVPPELDRIILRAMAKHPVDRYASVSALKEDLVRFMRGGADFPRRTFAVGEAIVREGEPGDAAYIVVEGRCDVIKETATGEQIMHVIGPGAVFGEMAILTSGPRTATVVAAEPTTVLVVTSQVLEQEMAALKPWMATLLKSLAERFRAVDTQHRATYAAAPTPARLANQILMTVATWGDDDGNGARSMAWSKLGTELEGQLGMPPIAVFGAVARYGMTLDLEGDRLSIPNVVALTTKLRAELGK